VRLSELPLTPNGKLDRRALPAPVRRTTAPAESARGPVEELVAGTFAEVLGVAWVGREESFFDLGGHSLLATRVIARLRRAFGCELELAELFTTPTVAGLATRLEQVLAAAVGAAPASAPTLERAPRPLPADLPLSFAQQRLWFLDQLEPGSTAYSLPSAFRLGGTLDLPALAGALAALERRHEVLRTRLVEQGEEVVQQLSPPAPFMLAVVDLAALPAAPRAAEAQRLLAAEAGRSFDLHHGPLWRSGLIRLDARAHVLLLTMHHIIADGASLDLLEREVIVLYAAIAAGRPLPAEPALQYADFAIWQRRLLASEGLADDLAFWRRQLAGAPRLKLPGIALGTGGVVGATQPIVLEPDLTAALRALGRQAGATLFMILGAGLCTLLNALSGQEDFSIGAPFSHRDRIETESIVGLLLNTLVLRFDLTGDPAFGTLLERARETVLVAHAHRDLPYERLVEELRPELGAGERSLFQVAYTLQTWRRSAADSVAGLEVEALPVDRGEVPFQFTLNMVDAGDTITGGFEYQLGSFDHATVAGMVEGFTVLLARAVAEPGVRLSELRQLVAEILTKHRRAEQRRLKGQVEKTLATARRRGVLR
jgi:acyl carrier protein